MKRYMTIVVAFTLMSSLLAPAGIVAQTPEATPSAPPVASGSGWQVTDVREIEVDGEPVALSPDGQWLAGTADEGTQVCAWDVETLTPTCAIVDTPVRPSIGNTTMRWAPDSSAFAFASGSLAQAIPMDMHVFDVASGTVTNLTNTGEGGPLYLGAAWTSDSQYVVFGVNHGFGGSIPDTVVKVQRAGGELTEVPLPTWDAGYEIMFPPLVAGSSVFVGIKADTDIAGIWKLRLDGAGPMQVVAAHGAPPVKVAIPVSSTDDGRYVNVVSLVGLQRAQAEGTFFLLDNSTAELTSLASEHALNLVSFGPDGVTGLMVGEVDGEDQLVTLDLPTGDVMPVANSPETGSWLATIPDWASNNTVFLPGDQGGTLITLARS